MDDAERKFTFTDRDLSRDYDETKLDRIGKPIGVETHRDEAPEQAEATQSKASHTLADMAKDYEFFTTGVIHAATIFDRDPVSLFNQMHPPANNDELPVVIDHRQPFFRGMGMCLLAGMPVNFDHRLYGILRHRWDKLRDTICGIAMMHRPSGFYAKLNFYELEIVDPFALKKMSVVTKLPTVTITVFGVSSNKSFSYLESAAYPALPFLVNKPPQADTKDEAGRVLGPPPKPESLLPKNTPTG
jgi:hypothetical protein